MDRPMLSPEKVAPAVHDKVAAFHRDVVDQVAAAVAKDHIVVVGMAQNPFCKKARALLNDQKIAFTYLEYGSYLSEWKKRLALKIWAGFPTFPMVFVDGVLQGGFQDLEKLAADGKLAAKAS